MTPDGRQRLTLGVLLAVHDSDASGLAALLSGVPKADLLVLIRGLAEVVVAGQLATEEAPGAARHGLASEALALAGR